VAPHDTSARLVALDPRDAGAGAEVDDLLDRARRATGHPPLSEASLLSRAGGQDDFSGLVHRSPAGLLGYAQLGSRDRSWNIETVVDPEAAEAGESRRLLLEEAVSVARLEGASEIRYWDIQHEGDDEAVLALGFSVERDLLQMRVPLPLHVERRPVEEGLSLRPFRPGSDEETWLEVNNRAFAAHPEQGHWDLAALLAREQADWFDPDGFIMCEESGQLAGSCWTKLHTDTFPALGEIYVISVNPKFQGRGLGRLLTVAGLHWLAQRVSHGMLYVDASNEAAVGLYRALGFTVDHVDRCYLLRP